MNNDLPSCCAFHGMADGCREGRDCPAGRVDLRAIATRRVQEHELRRQCAASDQMSARQLYEHDRAGDFLGDRHAGIVGHALQLSEKDGGVESAIPALVKPPREPLPLQFVGPEPSEPTWPFVLVTALVACVTLGLIAAYLLTHWNMLIGHLWPRLVFAASF